MQKHVWWSTLGLVALAICTGPAVAQTTSVCPGLGANASAAEQALCWADMSRRSDARCGMGNCDTQAVRWCGEAELDIPSVGHACFMANVRAKNLDAALGLAEYLQAPPPAVQRCVRALDSVARLQVVTNPSGASVLVDGSEYGPAPLTVTLQRPWWKHRVQARFGTTDVSASERALLAAFDSGACSMSDLVITGPAPVLSAPVLAPIAAAPLTEQPKPADESAKQDVSASEQADPEKAREARSSGGRTAWPWILTGVAAVAGGAAVGVWFSTSSKVDELKDSCAPGCDPDERDAITAGDTATNILAVVGGLAAGLAVVVFLIETDGSPETVAMDVSPQRIRLRGSF